MAFKRLISDLEIKSILVFDSQALLIYASEQLYDFTHEPEMLAVELLDFISSLKSIPLLNPDRYIIKVGDLHFFVKKHEDFFVALVVEKGKLPKAYFDFIKTYHRVIKTLL